MLTIKIKKLPELMTIPDADGDVTALKVGAEYEASDKGSHYRIYTPEDVNIPKEMAEVTCTKN